MLKIDSKITPSALTLHNRSLQGKIILLFAFFGVILTIGLTIQGKLSQRMIVHPIWEELLRASTSEYLTSENDRLKRRLPATGVLRGWRLGSAEAPQDMPKYFASLSSGFHDEHDLDVYDADRSYAVLVTPIGDERIIMSVDITELEDYQNMTALMSAFMALLSALMIVGSILWLYRSMRRPLQLLAHRMDELDPEHPAQRLQTDFPLRELCDIAAIVNRHLERVERFIERERSLLDQASHEFRTPIAVISGAADVLRLYDLPPAADAPLERIKSTTNQLTEIMSALLFLSREPDGKSPLGVTKLDDLVKEIIIDHQHLLEGKQTQFVIGDLYPLRVNAPEAVLRIVVGNLLRNAAENSYQGTIEVDLRHGCLSIRDYGDGFDVVAAARRYSDALRYSTKLGGGQGLGLFLIRRVCERFGWNLKFSSDPTRGTLAEIHFSVDGQEPTTK